MTPSWGQRLDKWAAWWERPIELPPLAPPERDALATAYPETEPGDYELAILWLVNAGMLAAWLGRYLTGA